MRKVHTVHTALARLYAAGVDLPLVEPDNDRAVVGEITDDDWNQLFNGLREYLGEVDASWKVFDPYDRGDPVAGFLSDDLADIYREVRTGLDVMDGRHARSVTVTSPRPSPASAESRWSHSYAYGDSGVAILNGAIG